MLEKYKKASPPFFNAKIRSIIQSFSLLALIWLLLIFIVSACEVSLNYFNPGLPEGFGTVLGWSFYLDIVFWLDWILFIFMAFLILSLFSQKLAEITFKTFIILFFIGHVLLINYFNVALVMLGADLFIYSTEDILQTVGASGGLNITSFFYFLVVILTVLAMVIFIPKKIKLNFYASSVVIIISLLSLLPENSFSTPRANLGSEYVNNLVINKSSHFYTASYAHYFPEPFEVDIYADNYAGYFVDKFRKAFSFEYVDESNYPFLREEAEFDVLTPYFEPGQEKPNVVIIIVEGLGRAFTNKGAYLGNFTPFLDSLADKSLYWKNFLSQGGRTFAVLPSILGSLPFAENGYLELGENMPNQHSLINLLNYNGYHTSFYYGGNSGFDNMKMFLNRNDIAELKDISSFPPGYTKLPAFNGFTWGYNDKELFRHYLNTRKDDPKGKPQFSVLLTVSMHNPFLINEQEKYIEVFENRMILLDFDDEKKKSYRNFQNQYSSILYTDDALRSFFAEYEKRQDFSNTVFVITGDHRIPEIPMASKIDRYHVPLIIYSPMLKRTATISSISTHNDIAPSLLNFLKNNHQLELPEYVSWQGIGLDTTSSFQNLQSFALMQTKTDLVDFVQGEYHLNGNELYKFTAELKEENVIDPLKKEELLSAFNYYKQKNSSIVKGSKIIPDSLHYSFSPNP